LRGKPRPVPTRSTPAARPAERRTVTAKYPNHVWHVDLTLVATMGGFWSTWLPWAMPQRWPFGWWVAAVLDHFSRRVMVLAPFKSPPTSEQLRAMLGRTMAGTGVPKYIICDRGVQFDCAGFKAWCRHKGIRPRYGAVGQHGGLAVLERAILTIKQLCRSGLVVPLSARVFRQELFWIGEWINEHRPHSGLGGRTPNELYRRQRPANRQPRFEPRRQWPRGAPCARPWALVKGKSGVQLELAVGFHAGRRHLPIIELRRAA